jgi:hypothetical protein
MYDPREILKIRLADKVLLRRELYRLDSPYIFPWRRPCNVNALMVTDGALDFGLGDFGLSAFVNLIINNGRPYVTFSITLAHLRSDVSDAQVMKGATGIAASFKDFRFDNPAHFTNSMYDEVWLFAFETNFHSRSYDFRNRNQAIYPANQLSNDELVALNAHMQRGGGVFATGDHGALGKALCGSVSRVRSMRYWDSHVVAGQDEVGMTNARRNDTNQLGDAGSQFSDQSDDIPQTIDLKFYSSSSIFAREYYPHPLLCGPSGRISILPDHPHEGECIEPASLTATFGPDGSQEYPAAIAGGPRISPEVIATSHVPAGNIARLGSSTKSPTIAHSFGAISAYDGHRAGVGRVVCDATWHHFVNVNLIGLVEGGLFDDLTPANSPTKHDGFLSTASGQAALAKIKDYFVNIGVWIATPPRHNCFNKFFWWEIIWDARIMEGALVNPDVPIDRISLDVLHHIGTSARDVIGRAAGPCRSLRFLIDVFHQTLPELVETVDPWWPGPPPDPPPFYWIEPLQLFDIALGAAVVSLRQRYPYPVQEFTKEVEEHSTSAINQGLTHGLQRGLAELYKDLGNFNKVLRISADRLKVKLN